MVHLPCKVLELPVSSEVGWNWAPEFHSPPKPCPHQRKSQGLVDSLQLFLLFCSGHSEIHVNSCGGILVCKALCWECEILLEYSSENM